MTSANDPHPSLSELTAFSQGRLAPAEGQGGEAHLARCAEGCARLEALPQDTLASRVRSSVYLGDTGPRAPAASLASRAVGSPEEGAPPVPPELASHPRYRLLGVIGSGGMGTVYKAEHLLMGRTVALKVIHRNLTNNPAAI